MFCSAARCANHEVFTSYPWSNFIHDYLFHEQVLREQVIILLVIMAFILDNVEITYISEATVPILEGVTGTRSDLCD